MDKPASYMESEPARQPDRGKDEKQYKKDEVSQH
jgi:hypothetical protein